MKHFRFDIVPAGKWRRIPPPDCCKDQVLQQGSADEGRPHFIPLTERAEAFIALDVFKRQTDLCPGYVAADISGFDHETYAYRFQRIENSAIDKMLADLDEIVEGA